jgi:hypothetical protein
VFLVALALVGFHVWLFAGRLRDATIREPEVLLRWILAAALLGVAYGFRRRGLSIVRGRSAIIFWVLALLLHLGPLPMPAISEAPHGLLGALQLAIAAPFLIALLAGLLLPRAARPSCTRALHVRVSRQREAIASLALRFAPRPPPAC